MSDNVEDAVPQILQAIQRQLSELRASIGNRFDESDRRMELRFDHVNEVLRKQRRDTAGLLVMAKSLAGNFAEELAAMEERVTALEAREGSR